MTMLTKLKREAKDWMLVGVIIFGCLVVVAIILSSIAWEILKVVAVIKWIAW
jgi:hypothetical protein